MASKATGSSAVVVGTYFDVIFDGPPGHEAGRFVEVEDERGHGIRVGEWIQLDSGYWALRINIAALVDTEPPCCDAAGYVMACPIHDDRGDEYE